MSKARVSVKKGLYGSPPKMMNLNMPKAPGLTLKPKMMNLSDLASKGAAANARMMNKRMPLMRSTTAMADSGGPSDSLMAR